MNVDFRRTKTWVLVTACSFFVYVFYWLVKSVRATTTYERYLPNAISSLGLIIRFIGASYALLLAYSFWKTESSAFSSVNGKLSKALLCEGVYYLSFGPWVYYLLHPTATPTVSLRYPFTAASYFIQILLVSPLLIALSLKLRRHTSSLGDPI